MSRSPIREVLPALEKEGTLEAIPHRGAIVKPLSAQEDLEIAGLRLALVSLAAKPAYPQLSPADFDRAADIAVRLNQTQDPVEFFYGIMGFWQIIFGKAQQPVLLEVLTQLESRATRYVPLFIRLFPDPEKRPRHREIFLEHFRKGKVDDAVRAFRKEYLIISQDNPEEILDSIPSPDLRRDVASYVHRIRAALGKDHEL
jgi:DNA-binding GntR family transcriptional regulator